MWKSPAHALIAALAFGAGGHAYADDEKWIQCDGSVVTSTMTNGKATEQSAPAHDVYAFDDATKHLFKYSEKRKALDAMFVTDYGPKQVKWASPSGSSYGGAAWTGTVDRDANTLKIVRHENNETMTWSETCKPIQPIVSG